MTDFLRIPEQHEYTRATDRVDEVIEYSGGAWVYGMSREQRTQSNQILRNKFAHAALGGVTLEPFTDGKPEDSLMRITHAYKHGALVGFDIAEITHGDLIDYQGLTSYVGAQLYAHFGDHSDDNDRARAELLVELSERGLRVASDEAREKIEKWAAQFTFSFDLRRMYALGVGATIFAGNHIHRGYLEQVFKNVTVGLDLSDPAENE